jgi:thiamine pyrophosphate-dependent acetolactate synthase large subunit-like protein
VHFESEATFWQNAILESDIFSIFIFGFSDAIITLYHLTTSQHIPANKTQRVGYKEREGRMTTLIDGGEILVESLYRAGIRRIFSVSGSGMAPIYRSCAKKGIDIIHTRHEGAAAFMADATARVTGLPGISLVTHGVGLTNASTGIASAWLDQSPTINLVLGFPRASQDRGNIQDIDQLAFSAPITKWARRVPETRRLSEYLATAARHALAGPPGPVVLELPTDVLAEQADANSVAYHLWPSRQAPAADEREIALAAKMIAKAKRPILIAGSGIRWAGAGEDLIRFAEAMRLPTFTRRLSYGMLSPHHPLNFGNGWFMQNGMIDYAASRCDLMILIGGRMFYDLEHGRAPMINAAAKILQVDIDPTNLGCNRHVDIGIVSDAGAALRQLEVVLKDDSIPEAREIWLTELTAKREESQAAMAAYFNEEGSPIHPMRVCAEIANVLPKDTIIVPGQGDFDYWADAILPVQHPGQYIRSGRSGCLGAEIPFGIAAKLARPDAPVLVTVGDGGFGFSAMELDTAARYNAPIVLVVGNDSKWNMIKAQMTAMYGEEADIFIDLEPRQYHKVAEAFGGYGEYVSEPAQVGPAFRRALDSGVPAVLNIAIRSFPSHLSRWVSRDKRHPLALIGYPDKS